MAMLETTKNTSTMCILAFVILMLAQGTNTAPKKPTTTLENPSLETFASSKHLQRYFDHRNLRSLRFFKNPAGSLPYINAFSFDETEPLDMHPLSKRNKRSAAEQRKLPNQPRMLKFGFDDAVEPSDEVKKLIHRHRNKNRESRQHEQQEQKSETKPRPAAKQVSSQPSPTARTAYDTTSTTTAATAVSGSASSTTTDNYKNIMKISPRGRTRSRRSVSFRQPANFKVQMIPFDISDAREPDEETSVLIKRGRDLDFQRTPAIISQSNNDDTMHEVNEAPEATRPKVVRRLKQKRKRVRREAPQTPPQMIKFELQDAKEPDASMRSLLQQQQQQTRSGKDLKEPTGNSTNDAAGSSKDSTTDSDQDMSTHESKRHYVYAKDLPQGSHISKKSINSLPHEVQKVISHLIKDNHHHNHAKAFVKYVPVQQADYAYLKSVPYGTKLIPAPHYGSKSHAAAPYAKYQKPEQLYAPPAPEKLRYSYAPAPAAIKSAYTLHSHVQAQQAITHPIVVAETGAHAHTSYNTQAVHPSPATSHFRPSKPDPLFEENKIAASSGHYEKSVPLEHYKYELISNSPAQQEYEYEYESSKPKVLSHHHQLLTESAATAAPLIKIEYHAPQNTLQDTYKELQEFKELSSLIGKSPDDQVHGLTYLLAKDMQNKIHAQRQQKNLEDEAAVLQHQQQQHRPQDNTAPILFHPEEAQQQQQQQQQVLKHSSLGVQPGRLIGMAKVKEYIPIVETSNSAGEEEEAHAVTVTEAAPHAIGSDYEVKLEPKAPTASSYIELSPNYELPTHQQTKIEHVIHHPAAKQHVPVEIAPAHTYYGVKASGEHHLGAGLPVGESSKYGLHSEDSHALQYASKYAFGYRIRDFHTGNDFGHKQNRDLDGVTRGQYHILLPDGRIQNVIYHADDTGFHADVSFESGH